MTCTNVVLRYRSLFVVLAVMCERRSRGRMLACVGLSAVAISAGVWVLLPGMNHYSTCCRRRETVCGLKSARIFRIIERIAAWIT